MTPAQREHMAELLLTGVREIRGQLDILTNLNILETGLRSLLADAQVEQLRQVERDAAASFTLDPEARDLVNRLLIDNPDEEDTDEQ